MWLAQSNILVNFNEFDDVKVSISPTRNRTEKIRKKKKKKKPFYTNLLWRVYSKENYLLYSSNKKDRYIFPCTEAEIQHHYWKLDHLQWGRPMFLCKLLKLPWQGRPQHLNHTFTYSLVATIWENCFGCLGWRCSISVPEVSQVFGINSISRV